MTTKRTLLMLPLIALGAILVLRLVLFSDSGTTVTIRNNTNQAIENLVLSSIDNKEKCSIAKIDPHANISFKYKIGGFNENAVNLRHISNSGNSKNYNIIGYVTWGYSHIDIDINSVEKDGELNIEVDVPR
ncbi:hypothetical protein [Alkaliphilus sp. B6464]|uniref:hypothetical protein n=1 Tax=Alkaliphilus sp. B6464 TaxID=2731219 RepID=UPI001BA82FB3|nr:hypothetical protein [Alkaliphilus sp. B6464]QUH21237.1 hypothetical protein HYG84_16010 [Alkaliphilus sp. B6464]